MLIVPTCQIQRPRGGYDVNKKLDDGMVIVPNGKPVIPQLGEDNEKEPENEEEQPRHLFRKPTGINVEKLRATFHAATIFR